MSKTGEIKEQILRILNDGKVHAVSDIKEEIRKGNKSNISEGVFAGCFRTLVLEKKCNNPDRGLYMINKENEEETPEKENCKERREEESALMQAVIHSVARMDTEIAAAMKGIDISVVDEGVLKYCIEIKKICNEAKERVNIANQILK